MAAAAPTEPRERMDRAGTGDRATSAPTRDPAVRVQGLEKSYKELHVLRGVDFDIARAGWCADYFDPFDYINVLLDGRTIQAANNVNFAYLNSAALNSAMDKAAALSGSARAAAYAALDLNIMKNYAPWAPYSVLNDVFFTSSRVGNWVYQPYFGEPAFNALTVG